MLIVYYILLTLVFIYFCVLWPISLLCKTAETCYNYMHKPPPTIEVLSDEEFKDIELA